MKTFRLDYTLDTGLPEQRHLNVQADGHTIEGRDHLFHADGKPVARLATKLVKDIREVIEPAPTEVAA
jgi:hypothetical protein